MTVQSYDGLLETCLQPVLEVMTATPHGQMIEFQVLVNQLAIMTTCSTRQWCDHNLQLLFMAFGIFG